MISAARRRRRKKGGGYSTLPVNLVLEGDSITFAANNYANRGLADAALAAPWDITLASNSGTSFATIATLTARAATTDTFINPAKRNVLSVLIGTNDVGGRNGDLIYVDVKAYCLARIAAGWKILICTDMSYTSGGIYNIRMRQFNSLIRNDPSFWHGLAEIGFDPNMGPILQPIAPSLNTTYFADGIHPSATGHQTMMPHWISGFRRAAGRAYPALASLTVSSTVTNAGVGGQQTFTAKGYDSFSVPIPTGTVVWSSSNAAVATINSATGVMTGVSIGTATITATVGAISGTFAASVVAFSLPRHIPNTHIWVRAELAGLVENDSPMAAFDYGGNKYHALDNSTTKIRTNLINGKAAYSYDGNSSSVFDDILSGLTEGEVFWVGMYPTGWTWMWWMGTHGNPEWIGYNGNSTDGWGSTVRKPATALGVEGDTPFIYNVISTPTEWTMNVNGVQKYTTATNTVAFPAIPKLGVTPGWNGIGRFGDFYVSKTKLSAGDRTLLYNELDAYYGISTTPKLLKKTTGLINGAGSAAAIDSTGASLIVVVVSCSASAGISGVSDNKGNTYTGLTAKDSGNARVQIYYAPATTVGSNHIVSLTATEAVVTVYAFSNVHATPFDVQNGAIYSAVIAGTTGSITPVAGDLIVSGIAYDSSVTGLVAESGLSNLNLGAEWRNFSSGVNYGGAGAFRLYVPAAAINPNWRWTTATNAALAIAAFKKV